MGRPTLGTRIKQRSNGFWYIVWSGNSKGRSTGTRDREIAEKTLGRFIIEDAHIDGEEVRLTVSAALDIYMAEHVEPRTKLAGRVIVDEGVVQSGVKADFLRAFFLDKAVADIMPDDITHPTTGYIAMRCAGKVVRTEGVRMKPCKPYSIRRDLGVLISALKWCSTVKDRETGRIRLPPDQVPKIPLPGQAPKRERWLTLPEETRLLAAAPATDPLSRIHRFIVLAIEDGARSEAIRELTWFQVDTKNWLTVDYRKRGAPPQSNKRRARVLMTSRSREMLQRAFAERTSELVLDHDGPIDRAFRSACRWAWLEGVTPHVLRHTWATRAARNGVPMRQIADQLADDPRTIERNYYHHSPDYMKEAASWRDKEASVPVGPTQPTIDEIG